MENNNLIVGRHYPALDGLRGIAVLMVLWFHASVFINATSLGANLDATLIDKYYYVITFFGSTGVELFFIISGFLITGILMDTSDNPNVMNSFYIRRVLRIFPLYYLVIFGAVLLFIIMHGWGDT